MSFDREQNNKQQNTQQKQNIRLNPVNIQHLSQPSPTVATLPVNPYGSDDQPQYYPKNVQLNYDDIHNPKTNNETGNDAVLNVVNYSDKTFVIFGDATKIHKESLKALGGKFNGRLKVNPQTGFPGGAGWIFLYKFKDDVMNFVNRVNNGAIQTQREIPDQGEAGNLPTVTVPVKNNTYQTVRWKVFLPREGMTVTVKANGAQMVGNVLQTETHHDIVDTCYIVVGETTSKLVICNGKWTVWGYMVDHSVFFSNNETNTNKHTTDQGTDDVVNI